MSDLDQRDDDLDIVFSVLVDCPEKNISFLELVPIIQMAMKQAYPEQNFKIIIDSGYIDK